jgi:hypothetical protein
MNDRAELESARRRLLHTLAEIASDVADRAGERCPYRDARERCTWHSACRNRLPTARAGEYRCSGASLNPLPAATGQS